MFNRTVTVLIVSHIFVAGCASTGSAVHTMASAQLPEWIRSPSLTDASYEYVICSHEALDPEEARLSAEGKCLTSAAKLGGVQVTVRNKTVQSLSGTDSGEVAEVQSTTRFVKCDFIKRFMEPLAAGFRVWLMCRVPKGTNPRNPTTVVPAVNASEAYAPVPTDYRRTVLYLTSVPPGEKVIVSGARGERVIDMSSNPQPIELKEGDARVTVRLNGFEDTSESLGDWRHAENLGKTLYLNKTH